ncbi:MAG: efflux RND transporter permease subunit [Proteobacteria bacterium]|nr:efflux RND transporter permease subunit [Pseudomonadota bacterium]
MNNFTDLFIRRPVLATVVSLMILVLGFRAMTLLPIRQFPFTQNAVVTVSTVYTGADPALIAGFITTPLENSIAQANGIDYLTSSSTLGSSSIQANLKLNYDPDKAMTEINTKVNAVLNLLPKEAQTPTITVSIGQTIDAMYIGFNSDVLSSNKITDYLVRVVQPKLQAIDGVQNAEILGKRAFALRAWLDPDKMSAFNVTGNDIAKALAANDFISAAGRTDGQMVTVNLIADTGLHTVEEFKNLIIKSTNGAIVRLKDVGNVTLGSENYDTSVGFDGQQAVYIGIQVAPAANLLSVIDKVRKAFPEVQSELPEGLNGKIVYDSTKFVNSSIKEVIRSLLEAIVIVTVVIFLFLGSVRSVLIPVIAIPLSLIGTFFIMLLLGYSINLLTLLALVLAIGLVVDDAIIVVENVFRHMEEGMTRLQAALIGARELANPIIAISVVLIAVYIPIGFMGGLTGALFTEFAFSLAAAVGISAVVALTLSPMMCSKFLKINHNHGTTFVGYINKKFAQLDEHYENLLHGSLNFLPVTAVFAVIILFSNYYLYATSKKELAPQEDQGVIISQLTTAPNASLGQTQLFSRLIYETFAKYPETDHVFQLDGISGLNSGIAGMVLTPWDERKRTADQLQPLIQKQLNEIAGARTAVFQPPPLPGSSGLPVQFVIQTTESYDRLNAVTQAMLDKVVASGMFIYVDTDLKIDKPQTSIILDREKSSELGLTMSDVGNVLSSNLSQNYVNFFNMAGRSYKVIPQVVRTERLNDQQLLNYYITAANGSSVPLSTIASLKTTVAPESVNHFQQLNSATIMGVPFPGITMGQVLDYLTELGKEMLPSGYTMDTAGQSRQYMQESSALVVTFFFALIIIFLTLAALFESFRDPLIVLISVPMSICGAMIFISLGIGGASLNIYTEVGLVTLIGLISKHGILIVQFANDLQEQGLSKRKAIERAATIRLRPILMTTASMVLGVVPLITASGAGAVSRYSIGLVVASGIAIGTLFTLFVVPAMYLMLADDLSLKKEEEEHLASPVVEL